MRLLKIAICALALAAFTAPSAHADDWNKKTFLTFSGPVQVPGTTLPAGTYMFKLADLESNRHVVQIFDKDGRQLLATFLTVPDYKLDVPKDNVVMFEERPRGMPQAMKAWWYVGDPTGEEFVYPKSQAWKIAKSTHEPVLSTADDKSGAMKGTKVGRVGESGELTAENESPRTARPSASSQAAGTTGSIAQNTTTAAPAKKGRTELPRTASPLTLFELLAAASLAGAFGVHELRKRIGRSV